MVAGKKRKTAQEEERMTPDNLDRVIQELNSSTPWTKKACCDFLGMSYNTKRLDSILKDHVEKREYDKAKRKEKAGKPATDQEVCYIIKGYIEGSNITSLADDLYRSAGFVKSVLTSNDITLRPSKHDYYSPELIPEGSAKERFNIGEVVFCARYNDNAKIHGEKWEKSQGYVYRVWLLKEGQFAYVAAYDLGSFEHLEEKGIKIAEE